MAAMPIIHHWNPEDRGFWDRSGRTVATRNLWLSIPALTLAFAVWMLWSVVVVHLPAAGFNFSTNQLFWLTALPALSGATLRIFYAFAVPIVGGRRFTALATASLLLPALGIGFAVRDPGTSYEWMIALAMLCGLGGANFASSMANISFFFPTARKGYALGLNAGLGHLGVAMVQLVVPLVIGVGAFGAFVGAPQATAQGPVWLQNAGFIWVPFIAASAVAAWFGMDDLADAKAGFLRAGRDLHAQAQLADVLALSRHLRQLHRFLRRAADADPEPVPARRPAAARLAGTTDRRAAAAAGRLAWPIATAVDASPSGVSSPWRWASQRCCSACRIRPQY